MDMYKWYFSLVKGKIKSCVLSKSSEKPETVINCAHTFVMKGYINKRDPNRMLTELAKELDLSQPSRRSRFNLLTSLV